MLNRDMHRQQNNDRTEEPISSIQKNIFMIFRPNPRVETTPPPIFISTEQNENNCNKQKRKKQKKTD